MNTTARADALNKVINHPALKACTEQLQKAYHSGGSKYPVCVPITGPSGSGKTTLAKFFSKRYPATESESGWHQPIVVCTVPVRPTLKILASAILKSLKDPSYSKGTEIQMTDRIGVMIAAQGTKLLILDEFQHMIDRDSLKLHHAAADWLKTLIDGTGVAVVVMGLVRCEAIFKVNEQLRRRFRAAQRLDAFRWDVDDQRKSFKALLVTLENTVHLKAGLTISKGDMVRRFHFATAGLIGHVMKIMREANDIAAREGDVPIDIRHIQQAYKEVIWHDRGGCANPFDENVSEEVLLQAFAVVDPDAADISSGSGKKTLRTRAKSVH